MNQSELIDFATRYAAAWSSRNPASLAAFYAEGGSLSVNAGAPSVGRAAISAASQEEWTIGADGLIEESMGHYDEAEYLRQLQSGAPPAQ